MIGIGGFLGSTGRFFLGQLVRRYNSSAFPLGTLAINLLGCLLMGLVIGIFEKGKINEETRLFLATGLCGGFTTFSAFSFESLVLLREGQIFYLFLYIGISVILGMLLTYFGFSMGEML